MIVIPAIDLMDGKAVRLKKGKRDSVKVYSENPVELIEYFNDLDINRVHIVDLDAAFTASRKNNRRLIEKLVRHSKSVVEVGGGIRKFEDVQEILDCGVHKVVIGTMAVRNPGEFDEVVSHFTERIIAGVDIEDGYIRISGWQESGSINYLSFLFDLKDMGIKEVIVTDISRDGMLNGVDANFFKDIAWRTGLDVIVSGGVKDIEDMRKIKRIEGYGVKGVIIGRAFYEKTLSLEEAVRLGDD